MVDNPRICVVVPCFNEEEMLGEFFEAVIPRLETAAGRSDQPTNTAAATTVVQRPFLSPTAVCVTFWVRTIRFESR